MRQMRWKCADSGCYRELLMPRLGVFDQCFPGKIGMSDVDAIVEIGWHFLLMEFKAEGGALTGGQRIMFERMTAASPRFTVVVVACCPQTMDVRTIQVFKRGAGSLPQPCNLDDLRNRVSAWAEKARMAKVRPSRRAA